MAGPRYVADPLGSLHAVPLEDLTALFHAPSGMTHLLAPPAPQILEALAGCPGDADEVLARISDRFVLEADDLAGAIEARLAELEAAGLLSRA